MNKYLIYAAIVFCVGVVGFAMYYSIKSDAEQEQVEQESLDSMIGKPLLKKD